MLDDEEEVGCRVNVELVERVGSGFVNRAVRSYESDADSLMLDTVLSIFQQALLDLGFVVEGKELVLQEKNSNSDEIDMTGAGGNFAKGVDELYR